MNDIEIRLQALEQQIGMCLDKKSKWIEELEKRIERLEKIIVKIDSEDLFTE